jgi:hypothetical protein
VGVGGLDERVTAVDQHVELAGGNGIEHGTGPIQKLLTIGDVVTE